jgi:hypothetical protein
VSASGHGVQAAFLSSSLHRYGRLYARANVALRYKQCVFALTTRRNTKMEQFFMRRASAVNFVLARRRLCLDKIASATDVDLDQQREVELIERLVLDVRAGRLSTFELKQAKAVAVIVTD